MVESVCKKQKMIWNGETRMDFFVTNYNDPHQLLKNISISINDLIEKSVEVDLQLPEKFSIFTRRLFKKYKMDIE